MSSWPPRRVAKWLLLIVIVAWPLYMFEAMAALLRCQDGTRR